MVGNTALIDQEPFIARMVVVVLQPWKEIHQVIENIVQWIFEVSAEFDQRPDDGNLKCAIDNDWPVILDGSNQTFCESAHRRITTPYPETLDAPASYPYAGCNDHWKGNQIAIPYLAFRSQKQRQPYLGLE